MKRLAAAALLAIAMLPAGAQAASSRCGGVAPMESTCTFSVVATTPHVSGYLISDLFTGVAEYVIEGPKGRHAGSCYAYPGVTTCAPSERGWFDPGDQVRVTVVATGVGSWEFLLLH